MRLANLRFWKHRFPIIGMTVALGVLSLISVTSFQSIQEFQRRAEWVEHTHQVISKIEEIASSVKDVESGSRGFIIVGRPAFLEETVQTRRNLPSNLDALMHMVADNAEQKNNTRILRTLISERLAVLDRAVQIRKQGGDPGAFNALVATGSGQQAMNRVRSHVAKMQDIERRLLIDRENDAAVGARNTKAMILFGTTSALLMIAAVFWRLTAEIRHRRNAERAVADANLVLSARAKELQEANGELESFSYSISHDLRIPLRAISGYARMLQEDYEDKFDAEGRRLLDVVRSNTKRMGELIDDLLTFSRLGRQSVAAADLDTKNLVESALSELQRNEGYASANLVVDTLPVAWGDRTLLYQVWMNLLSNAFKYSQTKDVPQVQIRGWVQDKETIYSVADNGVGFDMQYYKKLFGVFQRLHAADEFPGTGVGLAIVQRIVTRHGGRVWAEASLGQGATFFFALPVKG